MTERVAVRILHRVASPPLAEAVGEVVIDQCLQPVFGHIAWMVALVRARFQPSFSGCPGL